SGVTKGEPVVGAGGLVGQVQSTSSGTAAIELITEGNSQVGVSFGPSKSLAYGVVDGQGVGSPLSVQYVPAQTPLHKGELMYTNGLADGAFPGGIPVGRVRSFRTNVGSGFMSVTLTPCANLDDLAYVDVVESEPPL
ncbi:MAG: rod shape-determining protein MreC, partial [Acidimicrobiales bacterium]